jgi:hypothetical protein
VHRPNHGLANAIRKAVLVPEVAAAYKAHYSGGAYGSFDFNSSQLLAMQVAMLFAVCGRENDAGFNVDRDQYQRFRAASCRAFDKYARSKDAGIDEAARAMCLEALERMYGKPASARSHPYKRVFQTCHNLDLCRCFGGHVMEHKLKALARDVGQPACDTLAQRAECAILATGDRLLFSPTGGSGRGYDRSVFPQCSHQPAVCLKAAMLQVAPSKPSPPAHRIGGEGIPAAGHVRFIASHFKLLHTAVLTRWRITKWDEAGIMFQSNEVFEAVKALVKMFAERNSVSADEQKKYVKKLEKLAVTSIARENVEDMAVRLWTSADKLDGRVELCSILNEALRSDAPHQVGGTVAEGADCAATNAAKLKPAVTLSCMIQHHLGASRRKNHKHTAWPDGSNSSERDVVFRGAGLPDEHKGFFEELALQHKADPVQGLYRVPFLLASTFQERVSRTTFLKRISGPKVVFRIELDKKMGCNHVNYLDKAECAGESEFLFSAYSAFRVKSVRWSKTPERNSKPHEITILASHDNQEELEDVPTAPWH